MNLSVLFWQYQPWTWWVKTRNFYSSNSNCHRCKIFTSRYMFSKQAKTTELVRNRMSASKAPQYPIWPSFLPKMFVIPHQKYEINVNQPFPEFWNISGVTNCVAFPFGRGVCNAVVLYGINTPMQQFVLHLQLTTSMIAWGIGSKVIMTVIGLYWS